MRHLVYECMLLYIWDVFSLETGKLNMHTARALNVLCIPVLCNVEKPFYYATRWYLCLWNNAFYSFYKVGLFSDLRSWTNVYLGIKARITDTRTHKKWLGFHVKFASQTGLFSPSFMPLQALSNAAFRGHSTANCCLQWEGELEKNHHSSITRNLLQDPNH